MDALRATAATAAPIAAAATAAASTTDTSSSATTGTTTTEAKKSFATLFGEAKKDLKDGEKLTKVAGHHFARIKGGERDDMCVNLSGNGRSGEAFDLIWRDGRQFHVYGGGKGADHVVVEVGKKAAAKTDAAKTTGETTVVGDSTGASSATGTSTTASSTGTTTASGTAASGTTGGTTTTQS
jgi:hypothetical protein